MKQQQTSFLEREEAKTATRNMRQFLRDAGWRVEELSCDFVQVGGARDSKWKMVGEPGTPNHRCTRRLAPGIVAEWYLQIGPHKDPDKLEEWLRRARGRGGVIYLCVAPGDIVGLMEWHGSTWGVLEPLGAWPNMQIPILDGVELR